VYKKDGLKKPSTTEITESTEIFKKFSSVISVDSVVKSFGKPTTLDTPQEFSGNTMAYNRATFGSGRINGEA
jgi:hypothetical protein